MYVCLSVCPLAYLKNYMSKLHDIFPTCCLRPWLGQLLTTPQYAIYFRFRNDVMFTHNGHIHLSSNGKFNLYPMPDWLAEMAREACYGKRWYLLRPGGEVCYSPLLCSLLQHPTIWNSLPSFIRLSETLVSLRKYLRTHLMLPAGCVHCAAHTPVFR